MAEPPEINSAEQQKEFFWLLGIGMTMWAQLEEATVWYLRPMSLRPQNTMPQSSTTERHR